MHLIMSCIDLYSDVHRTKQETHVVIHIDCTYYELFIIEQQLSMRMLIMNRKLYNLYN